mgnify:CR=1 FL=1
MYSSRLDHAIITALEAHGLMRRKTGDAFEVSHVLSVALIVSDFGFSEDAIVAAVLHDTLEDTVLKAETIHERFGQRVLSIVQDLTEPPSSVLWRERKHAYIDRLQRSHRDETKAVAAADKIHNMSSILHGLTKDGHEFWSNFKSSPERVSWYYQEVYRALSETWDHPILNRQRDLLLTLFTKIDEIEKLRAHNQQQK